ncbi:adenylate/guanylate cyclase domain-containing protein [Candidatus Woesearchaeota archaeon]|jgi:adenylate cyclase|nr:adenylate/guanylate cyclase domain-containing protein [Candidatus Woesearchaeota archaeon]
MEPQPHSKILTIMFIDLVGYTSKIQQSTRQQLNDLQDNFDNLTHPIFKKHSGNIIKKIGDAFLITFHSPTDALLCAIDLQKEFQEHNKNNQNPLHIRVALHAGEVLLKDKDVYGDSVNITSRVESITPPDQIYFTESVQQHMNKNEIPHLDLGHTYLKGIEQPVRIFKVKSKHDQNKKIISKIMEYILLTIAVAVIILVFYFILNKYNLLEKLFLN